MLLELRIQNFAVIESLAIHCEAGLNALTGETGAGKSIIVGALGLLLGERASTDSIRTGAQKTTVEGVFDVAHKKEVLALLAEQGIEADDGLLILRREVSAEGRSRAWVNGAASTATFVGQLGRSPQPGRDGKNLERFARKALSLFESRRIAAANRTMNAEADHGRAE